MVRKGRSQASPAPTPPKELPLYHTAPDPNECPTAKAFAVGSDQDPPDPANRHNCHNRHTEASPMVGPLQGPEPGDQGPAQWV
mmetsp:Transcript_114458/g.199085  ORF Transcript_114458/g.199085 Transcript_114458/m.199085 type:complete len:83 (+) Transcript_114458:190-438(+)